MPYLMLELGASYRLVCACRKTLEFTVVRVDGLRARVDIVLKDGEDATIYSLNELCDTRDILSLERVDA